MFFAIPMQIKEPSRQVSPPIANLVLVVVNVLIYVFGSTYYGLYFSNPLGWAVGPGTGFLSILTYGFAHA